MTNDERMTNARMTKGRSAHAIWAWDFVIGHSFVIGHWSFVIFPWGLMHTFLGLAAEDWWALCYSVVVSLASVCLSLPFGIGLGWVLARRSFPLKSVVETAVNLPLVLPPVVTGYLLLELFGRRGLIGEWLALAGVRIAFTPLAAIVAGAVMGFPLMVRAIRLAFQGIDPRLYQAARSLGAKPFDAFRSVSLPLARNGVIAGVVLAFARGLGEFGATLLFAGSQEGQRTLAVQIYLLGEHRTDATENRMWLLVLASVVLACAALAASEYLERRGARRETA
jgi:molybdate transport system permease protein